MQYNEFPIFVPDQLLTSEHLNQVFNYLDEQDHLTRTCLLGVGIVCGLEVETNAAGPAITITRGCGITTSGFLVQVPTTTYTEHVAFDPVKERYYAPFVDTGTKLKKFDLYELVQAGVIEESEPLTDAFIADKVVLLFVELLEEKAKNCDPNSCDDKGTKVTITFRPLLVFKTDAATLIKASGSSQKTYGEAALKLPELRMRRFDVPATSLPATAEVLEAFLQPLDNAFLELLEKVLTKTYAVFADLVADVHPANPFAGLAFNFRFLSTRTMTLEQLLHTQYYYDLFSDVLLSYEELRRTARDAVALCCPDDTFPRHLLLGEARGYQPHTHSAYRHYFIPSPILAQQPALLAELRSLLIRLALLVTRFSVPEVAKKGARQLPEEFVRLTPSSLGDVPLSQKAIPYYYAVKQTPNELYLYWDRSKTRINEADKNLSYHAKSYNTHDDFVRQPLLYDLEPYNFLRAEGHIGQPYAAALDSLLQQKAKYRLPIAVIALSTDIRGVLSTLGGETTLDAALQARADCYFRDLETLYAALESQLICFLCKEMKYFYDLPNSTTDIGPASLVPAAPLLKRCDPDYRYRAGTYGQLFEAWIAQVKTMPYVRAVGILSSSAHAVTTPILASFSSGGTISAAPAAVGISAAVIGPSLINQRLLYLLYYMDQLSQTLNGSLASLDLEAFGDRFDDFQKLAAAIKELLVQQTKDVVPPKTEEMLDHLDKLIYACHRSELLALAAEFERRWRLLDALRRLAYYAKKCPGLQHKAGVPMGGTLILVYHQPPPSRAALTLRKLEAAITASRPVDPTLNDLRTALAASKKSNLDELIGAIAPGTVIADFYLPFICCSDCPPVEFKVASPEESPAPKISIGATEFCNDNQQPFTITVSPASGTLTGEGTASDANLGFVFVPANVDVGDNSSKEVELTYTVGEASTSVTVTVFHAPTASFRLARNADFGPGHVETVDASTFAAGYSWDFGDGTPPVTTQKAAHDYQQSGTYNVKLTVTNGPCSGEATVPITIVLEVDTQRLCLPQAALIDAFKQLRALDAPLFTAFTREVAAFADIKALFGDLANAGDMEQAKEVDFHVQHKTVTQMRSWLAQVQKIIIENAELRLLALELYRILTDLVLRIACFQDEDIDAAKVPSTALFKLAISHVSKWAEVQAQTAPKAKERIKLLLSDVQHEAARLKADESAKKPNYVEVLRALLKPLTTYPF